MDFEIKYIYMYTIHCDNIWYHWGIKLFFLNCSYIYRSYFNLSKMWCEIVLGPKYFNEVEVGYTGFTLSLDRIVSTLYLLQYLPDPFHIYTSYQATSEGVSCVKFISKFKTLSFGKFFKFVTLTLSCFDLGSNMNWSIVWVIMGRRGYPQNADVLVVLVLPVM